jgi:hypothetical protein
MHTAGIPGGFQTAAILLSYHASHSMYDLLNLVKLTGNFGQAYCASALMILLGRELEKEMSDLGALQLTQLVETAYSQGLPKLSDLRRAHITPKENLQAIADWFGYESFVDPLEMIDNPRVFINWAKDTLGYQYELKGLYPFHHHGCRAFVESMLSAMGQDRIPKSLGLLMLRLFTSTEGRPVT